MLSKYRKDGGDIIHIRHVTPEGAPLFTQGTELAEEFGELVEGMGDKEKVSRFVDKKADVWLTLIVGYYETSS